MDRYQAIDTFVRVAETGSFAEAARQMNLSKSVVSTRVQQLEKFLGVPLFHRSTRHVALSEIGEIFLRDCANLVSQTDELMERMKETQTSPSGNLRIYALPGFGLDCMPKLLSRFIATYPQIKVDLVVNDVIVDPVKEGYDCILQIFPAVSDEFIQQKLFPLRRVFCASRDYLEHHATIAHPTDLMKHTLGVYSRYPTKNKWTFSGAGEDVLVNLEPTLVSNSIHTLRNIAVEGGGVVCVPTVVASSAIVAGDLEIVLPQYHLPYYWLTVVFAQTNRTLNKLRLFLDMLTEEFKGVPSWDLDLVEHGLVLR